MVPHISSRVSKIISNPHFWLVVAMFAIGIALHYPQQILATDSPSLLSFLGLTRHAIERVFFLLPVTYAGFIFGIKAGLASLVISLVIMLPRVFLISLYLPDALFETSGIILIGGLVNLWFEGYRREKERRQQLLLRLEAAQEELQAYIQVVEADRKQLSALNAISAILSQSLELESILNSAFEKVFETMNLTAEGGIFLVDVETQELVLSVHRGLSPEFVRQEGRIALGECLCGLVAQSGELLFSEDCHNDVRHTRQSKAGSHSHIIVPLKSKEHMLGVMFLYPHASYHPSTQDLQLLAAIGNQIGAAIENANLYKRERVMVERIAKDAATEKQMRESLRFYLQQITRAQEEERRRIARELHDDTAQALVVLSRQLDSFVVSAIDHLSTEDISYLEELRQQAEGILDRVHRFSQDLRPSVLDDLGLIPALEWLASDLTNHFEVAIALEVLGSVHRFSPELELILFRIAQEALRNVWKHAEASKAWVTVELGDDKAVLTVKDNGRGFELPERIEDLAVAGKLGLAGMQERAQLIGGRLTLQSEPGKGTTVIVEVPI